jgi:glycosyltransferase involved in cell wall biosynthesis
LKVWHLVSNPFNSAICEYTLSSYRALQKRGCICLYSPIEKSPGYIRAKEYLFNIEALKSFSLFNFINLINIFRRFSPDVIIAYGGKEMFLAQVLKILFRKKFLLFRFCGYSKAKKNNLLYKFSLYSYKLVDSIICPGKALTKNLRMKLPSFMHIYFLQLGVDNDIFKYRKDIPTFFFDKNIIKLLLVARLDPVKGHSFFLEIYSKFIKLWKEKQTEQKICLHLVGEVQNISYEEIVKEVNKNRLVLNEDVYLTTSRIKDISAVINSSTIGVIPSLWSEDICRVAQEFLLCGLPVFISGVGALEDVLFPGAGVSYKGKNDEEIVNLLYKCVHEANRESILKRRQRANTASKLFTLEKMGDSYCSIFTKVGRQL